MDFHAFAVSQTAALVDELTRRHAAGSLQQLHELRAAADAAARAIDEPVAAAREIEALAGELTAAAGAEIDRVRVEAAAAAAAAEREAAAHASAIEQLTQVVLRFEADEAARRGELEAARTRTDAAERAANDAAQAQASVQLQAIDAAAALERAAAEIAALTRHVADVSLERDQALGSLTDARALERELAGLYETRTERDALAARLETSTARVQALEGDLAAADQARQEQEALRADEVARQTGAAREAAALREDVSRLTSLFDASARSATELAGAPSSSDLLTALVEQLARQFSRVALFRVRGDRLEGEHQIGFDQTIDIAGMVIPLATDSMLSRAAAGATQVLAAAEIADSTPMPLGGAPTGAVALPITLQQTTLAVVYADDSNMPDAMLGSAAAGDWRIGFARLLVAQVVILLIRHTYELRTRAELSQYATTLLQEAREMYDADMQAGTSAELLRRRLTDNIDHLSQLYTYRAAMEGTPAAMLLDEQIALETEGATPFARDLALVIGQMASSGIELSAEAS